MRAMVKSGAADIKAFLQRWPLAEGEAERLLVVLQVRAMHAPSAMLHLQCLGMEPCPPAHLRYPCTERHAHAPSAMLHLQCLGMLAAVSKVVQYTCMSTYSCLCNVPPTQAFLHVLFLSSRMQNKLLDRATSVDVSDITGEIQSRLNTLYMGCYIIGYDSVHLLHCRADGRLLGT